MVMLHLLFASSNSNLFEADVHDLFVDEEVGKVVLRGSHRFLYVHGAPVPRSGYCTPPRTLIPTLSQRRPLRNHRRGGAGAHEGRPYGEGDGRFANRP